MAIPKFRDGTTSVLFQSDAHQLVWKYFGGEESRVPEQILGFVRTRFFERHRGDHGRVDNPIGHRDLRESFSCCPREPEARTDVLPLEVPQPSDGLATSASSRTAISSPWSDRLWIAALRLSRLTTLSGTFLIESVTVHLSSPVVPFWNHCSSALVDHANSTATIPVRKIPSKVPAPPIDATGAPKSRSFRRLSRSAPMSVPTTPLMNATASRWCCEEPRK